jgi:hypothetical protein
MYVLTGTYKYTIYVYLYIYIYIYIFIYSKTRYLGSFPVSQIFCFKVHKMEKRPYWSNYALS